MVALGVVFVRFEHFHWRVFPFRRHVHGAVAQVIRIYFQLFVLQPILKISMPVPFLTVAINGLINLTPLTLLLEYAQVVLLQLDSLLGLQFLEQKLVLGELFLADYSLVYLLGFAAVVRRLKSQLHLLQAEDDAKSPL